MANKMERYLLSGLLALIVFVNFSSNLILLEKDGVKLNVSKISDGIFLSITQGGKEKLHGQLGVGLNVDTVKNCVGIPNCLVLNDDTRLHINSHINNGFTLFWTSNNLQRILQDCFQLSPFHWFGGPEHFYQDWPIEKLKLDNFANVLQEWNWSAVVEPYWLNSQGAYVFVDERTPLFIDQNSQREGEVCFSAKIAPPYRERNRVLLNYTIAALGDPRVGHLHAVKNFLGKPSGHPNPNMIKNPIWSTWARYKRDVNDSVVMEFAQEIVDNNFIGGQYELDDDWETCYGALEFRNSKFSKINQTVSKLKQFGFRVTLWAHPFVNIDCNYTQIGLANDFFVRNEAGSVLTQWWNSKSKEAQYLDFTKAEVREWYTDRLKSLQIKHGIDSFKFDAGETSWAPQIPILTGDVELQPNNLASDYVRTCAAFGDLVEVRSAWRSQDLPIFVRMIDKDSTWGRDNGLYTLITTLLQMNMNGYTLVLPDMIGGNGYYGRPSEELFIRWLQATVFMPSLQFSYVPWDYPSSENLNVLEVSRKFVDLHANYSDYIIEQMVKSVQYGLPVNAPIWWVDPDNEEAHSVDDEFLLGEDILVAPVIVEGAQSRNIYLPVGVWVDGNDGTVYSGNRTISNYNAPLQVLPFFLKEGSKIHTIMKNYFVKM